MRNKESEMKEVRIKKIKHAVKIHKREGCLESCLREIDEDGQEDNRTRRGTGPGYTTPSLDKTSTASWGSGNTRVQNTVQQQGPREVENTSTNDIDGGTRSVVLEKQSVIEGQVAGNVEGDISVEGDRREKVLTAPNKNNS